MSCIQSSWGGGILVILYRNMITPLSFTCCSESKLSFPQHAPSLKRNWATKIHLLNWILCFYLTYSFHYIFLEYSFHYIFRHVKRVSRTIYNGALGIVNEKRHFYCLVILYIDQLWQYYTVNLTHYYHCSTLLVK